MVVSVSLIRDQFVDQAELGSGKYGFGLVELIAEMADGIVAEGESTWYRRLPDDLSLFADLGGNRAAGDSVLPYGPRPVDQDVGARHHTWRIWPWQQPRGASVARTQSAAPGRFHDAGAARALDHDTRHGVADHCAQGQLTPATRHFVTAYPRLGLPGFL